MLGDFILELVTALGAGLTITLPGVAPAGRLTWVSRFGAVRQPVFYVLDDTVQEEWGVGTWIPGAPNTITRDQVIGNSAGTTVKLNFAGTTRCYNAPPSAFLWNALGSNVGRNLFHNPLFRVQQRGTGTWTATGYGPDRWQINAPAGGTRNVTIAALTDAARVALGDEDAQYYLNYNVTGGAAAADCDYLRQPIENVRRLAGKTVTVSFWAVATAGTPKIGISASQIFGTGGSPSTTVQALSTQGSVTISTTWTRYAVQIPIPSVSGKTLGTTAGTDYTQILLWFSSGATNNAIAGSIGVQTANISLYGMQCEVAPAPSPLEKLDPQQDLAKCQRFYAVGNTVLTAYQTAGSGFAQTIALPVPMRAVPTATPNFTTLTNCGTASLTMLDQTSIRFQAVATATNPVVLIGSYTATADL
jgi:hypothetical protein